MGGNPINPPTNWSQLQTATNQLATQLQTGAPPSMASYYTKMSNTTVNKAYDWPTTTAYKSYTGQNQITSGTLNDCYTNCKNDPKCKGFVRSRKGFGGATVADTSSGACYKIADNFSVTTTPSTYIDYYKRT